MAAVVDTMSFGAAAEILGMSQSGVSRAIARLESRLRVRIFERTTRSVRLTDEGRRFYDQVMPLVSALTEVTDDICGDTQRIRGRLRINVDPLFASLILGPRLGSFMDSHPELEIEMQSKDDLGDLVSDGFDLALRFGNPQPSSLVARKLFDTRMLTMVAPSYLQRFGHPTDLYDLEAQPHRCIMYRSPTTGKPFPWEFHNGKRMVVVQPHGGLTVNDPETVYSTCLAGLGIAKLFELGIEQYITSRRLIQLFPEWSEQRFPFYAYYPSRYHVPAKTRALLDFVVSLVNG